MPWNWELPEWPKFKTDAKLTSAKEKQFLVAQGKSFAYFKNMNKADRDQFIIEVLSVEALQSSKIEGEILDRESLQSSIKRHFGLNPAEKREKAKEADMATLLFDVYESFDDPLSQNTLFAWHRKLFDKDSKIEDIGKFRTHHEPMQIVSGRYGNTKVFFEAPPSAKVQSEMNAFIEWFNATKGDGNLLVRAAVAHVYFESIHPFEDGNGRIGRFLVEKVLSQELGKPTLIAVSKILEKRKKEYYTALERCNKTLEIQHFVDFFADVILQAQKESIDLLFFLIQKSKMLSELTGKVNERQEKVLLRIFAEGINGFKGGLSAENYISITKTSKATATRDLADLVEKKALIKTGLLRHTRYFLNMAGKNDEL